MIGTTSVPHSLAPPTLNGIAPYQDGSFSSISPDIAMHADGVGESSFQGASMLDLSSPPVSPMSNHLPAEDEDIHYPRGVSIPELSVNCETSSTGPGPRKALPQAAYPPHLLMIISRTLRSGAFRNLAWCGTSSKTYRHGWCPLLHLLYSER